MTPKSLYRSFAFILGLAAAVVPASAHSPADPDSVGDFKKLSAKAELVFHGRVKKVSYRNVAQRGGGSVPYSFVTYSVDDVLAGTAGKEITLRFLGGADGTGGFMMMSGVPSFSLGDEDILFVAGNGESGCALVQCEFGRYRVYQDAVYEAHGSPVDKIAGGRATSSGLGPDALMQVSYPAPDFDSLMTRKSFQARIKAMGMSLDEARAKYEAQAPKTLTLRVVKEGASAGRKRSPGIAVAAMKEALRQSLAATPRAARASIRSADITAPIAALDMTAAAPRN